MNNPVSQYNLDIFISGENLNLCIPTEDFAKNSSWYKWFNDPVTTRFLEQGLVPNTIEQQLSFYQNLSKASDRIAFIISDKEEYIGTCSLSFVNYYKRTADIAILIGERTTKENADMVALEAMARLTEFAFEKLGLVRISAGQHEKLLKWQNRLELLGYRLEGYKEMAFIKGAEQSNSVVIGVIINDYKRIKEKRTQYWDGNANMRARIAALPTTPFAIDLKTFLTEEGNKYYETIFAL